MSITMPMLYQCLRSGREWFVPCAALSVPMQSQIGMNGTLLAL